jgi:DNA-directed RNA polymerase specialized sigma24 family protein
MNRDGDLEALLKRALAQDRDALGSLLDELTPVIRTAIIRVLLRMGRSTGRDARQEVEDLTQELLISFFDRDAQVLRSWDRTQGVSLRGFLGLIAERRTISFFRTGKTNPWSEIPTLDDELDAASAPLDGPEPQVSSRQMFSVLWARLNEELSPKGMLLFDRLFVREQAIEVVAAETGLTAAALYAWRSRISSRARRILAELEAEPGNVRMSEPNAQKRRPSGGTEDV